MQSIIRVNKVNYYKSFQNSINHCGCRKALRVGKNINNNYK